MMRIALKLCVVLSMLSCGCGYQTYMDRYGDSLAEQEYNDELEQLLGPPIDQGAAGFRIRLPKQFRVNADEVYLKRTSDGFLVIEKDPWDVFFEGVNDLSEHAFTRKRVQPPLEARG